MKGSTRKLTRAGILTAMAVALLYAEAWVPRGGIALAALACLVGAAVLIECGLWWALGHYLVTALLALLLSPDKTPALWYALVLGPWPVLKHVIERLESPVARWALKLAAFTGAMPEAPVYFLLPALALVFIAFDIAFTRLIGLYVRRVHRAGE